MKIFDCTTYFNEPLIMDVRFNILDKHVDKFIVVESTYSHSGTQKEINFDKNLYPKFKNKIQHVIIDKEPDNIIYEVNNPYEVWKKFKISYKKETKENELYNLIEKKIDTINLFLENELINFSKENKLLIGINIISKNKIESIFFIEKNKINKKYFFKKIDSLGYAINERIYNENKIYELNLSKITEKL